MTTEKELTPNPQDYAYLDEAKFESPDIANLVGSIMLLAKEVRASRLATTEPSEPTHPEREPRLFPPGWYMYRGSKQLGDHTVFLKTWSGKWFANHPDGTQQFLPSGFPWKDEPTLLYPFPNDSKSVSDKLRTIFK